MLDGIENVLLAIFTLCMVAAVFCFMMARYVPRDERIARRRRRVWKPIAAARGMTFDAGATFALQGSAPRVGALRLAVEFLEGGLERALVVRIPLVEGPRFDFELSPRGHPVIYADLWQRRAELVGDPAIDGPFVTATTDLPALLALSTARPARGKRHPAIVWVQGGFDQGSKTSASDSRAASDHT
jgi:hypothetical protein